MKFKFVLLLIVLASLVGGALVYVVLREPQRPVSVNYPPAAPVGSPNTSADYKGG